MIVITAHKRGESRYDLHVFGPFRSENEAIEFFFILNEGPEWVDIDMPNLENPSQFEEEFMATHRRFPFIFKPVPKPMARSKLFASPIEDSFWRAHQRLKLRPLAGLVRQYKVGQYRLDFALPHKKIGIELDGHLTHSSPAAIAADRRRQRWLESKGWYIIRFGGQEVFKDADGCIREAALLVQRYGRQR